MTFPWRNTIAYPRVLTQSWEPSMPAILLFSSKTRSRKKRPDPDELIGWLIRIPQQVKMTWSWGGGGSSETMQFKCRPKKKQIKEKNELKPEKWEVLKKSGVLQIEHYSKTCWLREEETRFLQLQIYKLRAFSDKRFSKTWKIHILKYWPNTPVSHWIFRIPYWRLFFVHWLNSCGVSYQGGTALWSWRSSLFQNVEVVGRCFTWSWMCLAALDAFDVVRLCSEVDKADWLWRCSGSAPFPDSGPVVSMMKTWFR